MNVMLTHEQGLKFTARGDSGFSVEVDASTAVGGRGEGFRPMELFLISLASCTSIDTVLILNKSKKFYRDYHVKVEGKRREKVPKYFTEIDLYFFLKSDEISFDVFYRAVDLSLTKYCSVAEMISPKLSVKGHIELNGKRDERVIERSFQPNL